MWILIHLQESIGYYVHPIESAIHRECEGRFRLGHSAPISKTLLGEEVGYLSDSQVAQDIIMGTYVIPEDMEEGMALVLTEFGRVGRVRVR